MKSIIAMKHFVNDAFDTLFEGLFVLYGMLFFCYEGDIDCISKVIKGMLLFLTIVLFQTQGGPENF